MLRNHYNKLYEKSIKKIAAVSLKYSANALLNGTPILAKKYWHLSLAIAPELENSSLAQALSEAIETGELDLIKNLEIAHFDIIYYQYEKRKRTDKSFKR